LPFFGFFVVVVVDEVLVVVGGAVEDVVGRTVEDVEGGVVVVDASCVEDVELLVVTRAVVDVDAGGVPSTVLVVGRPGAAIVVVVVVVVPAGSSGHDAGAGASRAANFPGSSRRTSPPKSMQ